MTELLRVEGVSVAYGQFVAVEQVDLGVPHNSTIGLLGANGVGKSTVMRTVAGLLEPQSGRIVLDGDDVVRLSARKRMRRGIAYVPEGGQVVHNLSVRENLVLGGFHLPRAELEISIERVLAVFPAIRDLLRTESWRLSGGEQQMVAVARALMSSPRLLLMDEPSLGLAPVLVGRLFENLMALRQAGKISIVLVEQNFRLATRVAEYLYFMKKGRIVLHGKTEEILGGGSAQQVIDTYLGI